MYLIHPPSYVQAYCIVSNALLYKEPLTASLPRLPPNRRGRGDVRAAAFALEVRLHGEVCVAERGLELAPLQLQLLQRLRRAPSGAVLSIPAQISKVFGVLLDTRAELRCFRIGRFEI